MGYSLLLNLNHRFKKHDNILRGIIIKKTI